jgi:hypothetical protein
MTGDSETFAARYGRWAIVTGAAQGIGSAFADELAARDLAVLLVDRDVERLAARTHELRGLGAEVREVAVDLAAPGAAESILEATRGLDVGLLVSNAALSWVGRFTDQPIDVALAQLEVNCRVPLVVVHAVLDRLVERGRGGIVLVSSGSGLRGSPLVAGYAATKAWTLVLAESLWDEVRDAGVDVMAVIPGTTRTPGWIASNPQPSLSTAAVMEPGEVVREALDALGTVPSIQPGATNRDSETFLATMDRGDAVRLVGEVMRATYPDAGATSTS